MMTIGDQSLLFYLVLLQGLILIFSIHTFISDHLLPILSSVFDDYDDEDVDDCFLNHLLVVKEHSAPSSATTMKKHDRAGACVPRSKMNAMIARHISESLLEYEQEIFAANTQVGSAFERTERDRYCKCGLFEFGSFIQTASQQTERAVKVYCGLHS